MSQEVDEIEEEVSAAVTILDMNCLDRADLSFQGITRFRKLAAAAGMDVTLGASRALIGETYYAMTNKTGKAGQVKKPAHEVESVWAVAISPDRTFAAWAHWENGSLLTAKFGGPALDPEAGPQVISTSKVTAVYAALSGFKDFWKEA